MYPWLLAHWPDPGNGVTGSFALGFAPWWRVASAGFMALALCLVLGYPAIALLRGRCREPIRTASAQLNSLLADKRAVPTMGGLFVVGSLLVTILALCDLGAREVQLALVALIGLTVVGFVDDAVKLASHRKGIRAWQKLILQSMVAVTAAVMLLPLQQRVGGALLGLATQLPLTLVLAIDALVIVGFSNAVNLTDGLDGLATGCLVCATAAIAGAGWLAHGGFAAAITSQNLHLFTIAAALLGSLVGFLWFNRHPAKIFLGDTGSLPLGGLLAILGLGLGQELVLLIAGAVFVAEAGSVVLQVGWFRFRGRRILRCAPLHHHFQFLGWTEVTIVRRFWQMAACCALLGLAIGTTQGLRGREKIGATPVGQPDRLAQDLAARDEQLR